MRNHTVSWSCAALVAVSVLGCSGNSNDELGDPLGSRDAALDASSDGGSAAPDASEPSGEEAGLDATLDAEPAPEDAGLDAANQDAELDAAGPDASSDAAVADDTAVFATFGNVLVRIDPDDATLVEVGVLTDSLNSNLTYQEVVMHGSGTRGTAVATLGWHTPRLATVDLCNARVTVGATVTRPTPVTANLVVEGLARHTNGTWYVASGNSASTLSRSLGTIDLSTGIITNLSTTLITSVQNDMDMLFFRDGALYTMDVATDLDRSDLFTLDLVTGAASNHVISMDSDEPLRLAYDESRDKVFSWRVGDRNLLEINLTTMAATAIGQTHPSTSYGNALVRGFFVAPVPVCP